MGRHNTHLTVFADATGARTRALRVALRTAAAALVAIAVVVLVSFLSGVPMPGFTRPARLPAQGPAAQDGDQRSSDTSTPSAGLTVSTSPAAKPTPAHATTPGAVPTSAAATPTSTPASSPTTPGASTSTSPGRTHGNKPPTPPGKTRHP